MKKNEVKICGHELKFTPGQIQYIQLRQQLFKVYAVAYARAANEFFDKFDTIDDILKKSTAWFGDLIIKPVAEAATAFLIKQKHYDLTVDAFIDECIDLHDWQDAVEYVIAKKMELEREEAEREGERAARTDAAGSAWVGGGFGIEGAIKGALKAECLNLAGAAVSGVFNSVGRLFSGMANVEKDRNFCKSLETKDRFLTAIAGVYVSALQGTLKYAQANGIPLESIPSDPKKQGRLIQNINSGIIPNEDIKDSIIRALQYDYFSTEPYKILLERYGDEDGSIQAAADFFGISLVKTKAVVAMTELFHSWKIDSIFDMIVARKILAAKAKEMGYVDYMQFPPLEECIHAFYAGDSLTQIFKKPCFPHGEVQIDPEQVKFLKQSVGFFDKLAKSDACYIAPYIPDTKIQGALNHFMPGVDPGDIICLVDMTIMGGCEEGFGVTKDALYSIEGKEVKKVSLASIRSITGKEENALKYVFVNRARFAHWVKSKDDLKCFTSCVMDLAKFVHQTTPGEGDSFESTIEQYYKSLKIDDYFDCLAAKDMLAEKAREIGFEDYQMFDPLAGIIETYQDGNTPDKALFPHGKNGVDQQKARLWKKRIGLFGSIDYMRLSKLPSVRADWLRYALNGFAEGAKADEVIALWEDTLLGRGGKGVLVTTTAIYAGTAEKHSRHSLMEPAKIVLQTNDNCNRMFIDGNFFYEISYGDDDVVKQFVQAVADLCDLNVQYPKKPFISKSGDLFENWEEAEIQEKLSATFENFIMEIDFNNTSAEEQKAALEAIRPKMEKAAANLKLKGYAVFSQLEDLLRLLESGNVLRTNDHGISLVQLSDEAKVAAGQAFADLNDEKIFVYPNIPNEKLHNAVNAFKCDIDPDRVIVLIDDTVLGGADEGVIVTLDALYSKSTFGDTKKVEFTKCDAIRITYEKKFLGGYNIGINGEKFASLQVAKSIPDFLNDLVSFLKKDASSASKKNTKEAPAKKSAKKEPASKSTKAPEKVPMVSEKKNAAKNKEKAEKSPKTPPPSGDGNAKKLPKGTTSSTTPPQPPIDFMEMFRKIKDGQIFITPNIPEKKLKNAIASYASGVSPENVMVLVDDTVWGGAKEGMIVTRDALYAKALMESPVKIGLSSDAIVEVVNGKEIHVDGQNLISLTMPDKKSLPVLISALNEMVKNR